MKTNKPKLLKLEVGKYWLVKKYGEKPIYSGKQNNLAKFLNDNL